MAADTKTTMKKLFQFYLDSQKELVKQYNGQYLVIVDDNVVGHFDTFEQALSESQKKYEAGKYLIQHCVPGEESYTQTFHTRAVFN